MIYGVKMSDIIYEIIQYPVSFVELLDYLVELTVIQILITIGLTKSERI